MHNQTECVENAVMEVEHGGDAIEAEAIEMVLVQVPPQIGQQKPQHLPRAVVE